MKKKTIMKSAFWAFLMLVIEGKVLMVMAQDIDKAFPKDSIKQDTISNRDTGEDTYSPLEQFLPPSPQAAALARYGEYPVSLATGVPEINIPLYEIKLGNYTLPISISYHASGIKVDDVASTVGLGWVLNAGGAVSRTVCGAPDLRSNSSETQDTLYRSYERFSSIYYSSGYGEQYSSIIIPILRDGLNSTYDIASDRYSYNFGGKAGIFRYSHRDRRFVTLNHQPIMIFHHQLGNEDSYFEIIDSDGITYIFHAIEHTLMHGSDYMCPTSWYVTQIQTPNGNINFTYENSTSYTMKQWAYGLSVGSHIFYDSECICMDSICCGRNSYSDSFYHYNPLLVKKITWKGNSIEFTYSDRNDRANKRLTTIKVKGCDGSTYKTVSLNNNSYLGNSEDNYRMMLSSISISDEGTYTFYYNNKQLPDYDNSGHRDYWGYYNTDSTYLYQVPREAAAAAYHRFPQINYNATNDLRYANRNPNLVFAKAGILESIYYPTGGHTQFTYELNLNGGTGGLRIASITDVGPIGTTSRTRTFTYSGHATQNSPKDALVYTTYHGYEGVYAGITYRAKASCSSESLIPLCDGSGSTVFYDNVTETDGLGNQTKYYYTYGGILSTHYDTYFLEDWPQICPASIYDEGTCDPLLSKKECYEGNKLLRREIFEYQENRLDSFDIGIKILNTLTCSGIYGDPIEPNMMAYRSVTIPMTQMRGFVKTFSLKNKTVIDYKQVTGSQPQELITTTESYTYDPQFRTLSPKTISTTNSDGRVFRTVNEYPFECTSSVCVGMYDQNMADRVVATRQYVNNTLVKLDSTLFVNQNTNWYYPYKQFEQRSGGSLYEKLQLTDYDAFGNPCTIIENGTDKTAIVWGFNSNWPMAKVSGMSYSDLTGLGLTNTLNSIAQDSVPNNMVTYLSTLRSGIGSNGLVTTYNYKPLFGPSAITTEYGYTTYYDYTDGKLSAIRDYNGPLQQFTYQYAHAYNGNTNSTNYVQTKDMLSSTTGKITCQYYDGLGRPVETAKDVNGKYVYTQQTYDAKGRVSEDWLSAPGSNTLNKLNSIASISSSFYGDNYAYSATTYDALDRPVFTQTPGQDWHNAQKGIIKEYQSNTANSVKCYHAVLNNNSIIENGFYAQNTLYAEKTTDEDGRGVTVYSDKLGRKVLERRDTDNDTYFVYDDLGDLRFVLPPQVAYYYKDITEATISTTSTQMLQYGYEYRYDSRHNCIYKRLPGCDPVYYVYDKAGRCILSQDGKQRTSGVWTFMLPDVYGRTGLTGTCTNSITYTNEPLKNSVVKAYRSNPSSSIYGYAVTGFSPNLQLVCTVNYYDDYTFIGSGLAPTTLSYGTPPTGDYGTQGLSTPRGLLTGTAVGRLNSSGITGHNYSAIYYDGKGRIIQTRGTNHMGGTEYEYTGYNYAGNVLKRQHVHTASGMSTQTETYTYEYNTSGLLAKTKHKLNTNSEVTLHQYTYNDIGQLTGKTNGGISSAAETYTYNVRSWLKTISSTLFSETLYYNDTYGGSTAQYGGNVSAMTWNADSKTRGYKFTYDNLLRLTKADYMENGSTSTHYKTEYTYDRMGNFLTLKRYGKQNNTTYSQIDILSFTYTGNQVTRIDDSGYTPSYTDAFNFVNGASQSGEYTYDQNGNMTKDLNKNISSIGYNLLNLPTNITYSSGKSAAYIYDATGRKLRTSYKASASATAVPTDYCGNMIYENNVLKQALIDGGYITFSGTAPYYHFYLQDHLGNNRVVVSPAGTAEQINHYYPFGGLFGESTGNAVQRFRYNGKELDRTHGIDWYDYGARHMSPDAGRFTTIDPMAEKYYNISPYAYCANNPVNAFDPDGKEVINKFDKSTVPGQKASDIFINKINDLSNAIIIFAHGAGRGSGLSVNNEGITQHISVPYELETFLENNSEIWNNRFINGYDLKIILFSCETGSEGKFAQTLSMDESFQNIKIIAPADNVTIYGDGTSSVDNNSTWVEYTNGNVSNKYNGSLLPGTTEFEESSYWEKTDISFK